MKSSYEKILLIDALNLFLRSFCASPMMNSNGEHVGGMFGFLNSLKFLTNKFKPTKIMICWEGQNSYRKRQKLYSDYKAGRKLPKKLNRVYDFDTATEEAESFKKQIYRVKEYLKHLPVYEFQIDFTEADDIIAYIAQIKYNGSKKIIVSTDKDFWQLIDDKTLVFTPIKKLIIDDTFIQTRFSIHSINWLIAKCFFGDTSDNIKGIKGIGEKKLIKLFPFLSENRQIELNEIFDYANKNKEEAKLYNSVISKEGKKLLRRNYKLMNLLEGKSVSTKSSQRITEIIEDTKLLFNPFKIRLMFMEDSIAESLKYFENWKKTFLPVMACN